MEYFFQSFKISMTTLTWIIVLEKSIETAEPKKEISDFKHYT